MVRPRTYSTIKRWDCAVDERLARRMLESLKIYPLLNGYRGWCPVNIEYLIEILIRLSYLAANYPEIQELDINPILVSPSEVIALDARVLIDKELLGKPIKPNSHLVLRPYFEEYVRQTVLKSADPITLRPTKPEDEPMWMN